MQPKMNKESLRKHVLRLRSEFDENYINDVSKNIFEKIKTMDIYKQSKTVMIYVSFEDEVNTHKFISEMIKEGKKVVTPVCNYKDRTLTLAQTTKFPDGFQRTKFGILEIPRKEAIPVDLKEIDMIITPGVAFTKIGKRLGYGAGFYDRLLLNKRKDTPTVCPVFKEFIFDDLPTDDHDVEVDFLVTSDEIIKC